MPPTAHCHDCGYCLAGLTKRCPNAAGGSSRRACSRLRRRPGGPTRGPGQAAPVDAPYFIVLHQPQAP